MPALRPASLPIPRSFTAVVTLALFMGASVASLQAQSTERASHSISPAAWTAFTKTFDTQTDSEGIVGGAVRFVCDGRSLAHHEHGFADRGRGVPITERTIFHYASITKTLTAISIMQLRDRGKLTLDDRVTSYIPELRMVHDPYGSMDSVTIRMLMSHAAGFQNPTWPWTKGEDWEPFEPTTWNQLVAMLPYEELLFRPGTKFSYSNPGFIYLARIIEQLSGDPWETYVQKNIFSPLGLSHSYFGATPYYLAADRSHRYYVRRDSASGRDTLVDEGADFNPGITIPNGGWNAPLTDVETYLAFLTDAAHGDTALQHRYDVVLPHRDLEEMWIPRYPTGADAGPNADEWMGMSFFTLKHDGATFVGHTGDQGGYTSFMYLNPKNACGVAAVFNTQNEIRGRGGRAFNAIREAALGLIE
jgi:CubicO group peptidase (beta-lactamase class C family)